MKFPLVGNLVISLIVGLFVSLLAVSAMKRALISVHAVDHAADYVRRGSISIDIRRDQYLYSNTVRTAKPKKSSTHRSSSGRSHGGGGGSF